MRTHTTTLTSDNTGYCGASLSYCALILSRLQVPSRQNCDLKAKVSDIISPLSCICSAQSKNLCNPRIAQRKAGIHTLVCNPRIVCQNSGNERAVCANL